MADGRVAPDRLLPRESRCRPGSARLAMSRRTACVRPFVPTANKSEDTVKPNGRPVWHWRCMDRGSILEQHSDVEALGPEVTLAEPECGSGVAQAVAEARVARHL